MSEAKVFGVRGMPDRSERWAPLWASLNEGDKVLVHAETLDPSKKPEYEEYTAALADGTLVLVK